MDDKEERALRRLKWMVPAAILPLLWAGCPVQTEAERQVGEVVGTVLSTDIRAYVNGQLIPSMNIGGYTAVAAEDLRRYGFEVAWSPQSRSLTIYETLDKALQPLPAGQAADTGLPVGTVTGQVLHTDIRAFYAAAYGDSTVASYNVNGRTALLLNDLQPFGDVIWDAGERTIRFDAQGGAGIGKVPRPVEAGTSFSVTAASEYRFTVEVRGRAHEVEGVQLGYVTESGVPLYDVILLAERLGYTMTRGQDGWEAARGLHRFRLSPDLTSAAVYWDGAPSGSYTMTRPPLLLEDRPHAALHDLVQLFGLACWWSEEGSRLELLWTDYRVRDFGLPAGLQGSTPPVRARIEDYAPRRSELPPVVLSIAREADTTAAAQGIGVPAGEAVNNRQRSTAEAALPLGAQEQRVNVTLLLGQRPLYRGSYTVPSGGR
ncbi:hypothetical protein [Paenibacillus sp. KR2-11]|uniref:hypothetical protein n=1 Tax=Paenibacillus sp. KR2-11 TaxID=3385500 RepID=UPI0038FCD39D